MDILKKRFAQFSGEGDDSPEVEAVEEVELTQVNEEVPKESNRKFFPRLASFILLAGIFLLPVFFIPSQSVHFLFTKQLIFVTVIAFAVGVWFFRRLKSGTYEFPVSKILVAGGLVVVATLLSVLFSGSISESFIGQGFEVGTFISVLIGFLAVFIIPIYFTTKDKIFSAYTALFAAFAVLSLFEILRLIFGPGFLAFGIFTDMTSNILGKWNDLGIFFGLTATLSLITLEFFSSSGRLIKVLSYITLVISLFFLALVNFSEVWIVLGLFSIVLFVYLFSFSKDRHVENLDSDSSTKRRRFPGVTLAVVVISLVFILVGGYINNSLSTAFKVSQLEVRPSWQSTLSIAKETIKQDPVFGVGPNHFVKQWLLYKDPTVNSTVFWNSDFSYGVGLIPTYLINTGILGFLAWLLFLGVFVYTGFKTMFLSSKDKTVRYLTISSFLGALFLWIFNFIYSPSNVVVALTFIITGLFIASLVEEGTVSVKRGFYTGNAKLSFISVLSLIFLLVVVISVEYFVLQRYISYLYFEQGLVTLNSTGNVDQAEAKFLRATSLSRNDLFYRALTEVGIIKMGSLVNGATKDTPVDVLRTQFQNILGTTLGYAGEAINISPASYENWIERGRVYEAVVPLNITGAYDAARTTYEEALKYNPHNPSIYLMIGRLEYTKGDNVKAKEFITKALAEKNNYIDAIFLLSQVQIKDGDLKSAISSVEAASVLSPNDPSIFFQLGLLKYNNSDWKGAMGALEQAIALSPVYANAKYFLGLSYQKLGRIKDSIAQFNDLKKTNPDNKEIDLILSNLNAGKDPFANATPPINTNPAKGTKPPLQEKGTKKSKTPATVDDSTTEQ